MPIDIYTPLESYRYVAFPLNNDGTFDLTEDPSGGGVQDLYEGIDFEGVVTFDVALGAPRTIGVPAQGQIQTTFILPSVEPQSGTVRTSYGKLSLDAALGNINVETLAEGKILGYGTDKSGQEKLVALFMQQLQAQDEENATLWKADILHRVKVVANPNNYTAEAMSKEYNLGISKSTKRMWGETNSLVTHGYTKAAMHTWLARDKQNVGIWMGNGEYTTFNLPAGKAGKSSASAKVWDYTAGTARAGTWNAGVTIFTPTVMPPDGTVLVCMYEIAP